MLIVLLLSVEPDVLDACTNTRCGSNAECINGQCQCLPEYRGDPYLNCRPECVFSTDCEQNKACVQRKCIDPCIEACGQNAVCQVVNHIPMCSCNAGFTGNAFVMCNPVQGNFLYSCIYSNNFSIPKSLAHCSFCFKQRRQQGTRVALRFVVQTVSAGR